MKRILNQPKAEMTGKPVLLKSLIPYLSFALFISFIILNATRLEAQSCELTLGVSNNIESVNEDGRVYFLTISNKTASEVAVTIALDNVSRVKNPDESSNSNNVSLNATLLDSNGQPASASLVLSSGASLDFQVKVTVPARTPLNRWNQILVSATSSQCPAQTSELILYTFIPDLSQE